MNLELSERNKRQLRMFLIGIFGVFLSGTPSSVFAVDPPKIDGTYKGIMTLTDEGPKKEIPFSIALTITDELEKREVSPGVFEMGKVIDGNFLIDKEGGPFAFTKVTYRLSTSEIDMRYSRTKGVTVGQPSSYRLVGKVAADGSISGRILSGFKGQIGTFKLVKDVDKPLVGSLEYAGVWTGVVKLLPENDLERFGLSIASTGFSTTNPEHYEFDYTPGKIGHADFGIAWIPLPNVAIDYLHRRVVLSDKGTSAHFGISVQATLDFKTGHLKGFFSSLYGGRRGEFDLVKFRDGG